MDNDLNNTQTAPDTRNPQDVIPADGASRAEDFQSTAPQDALNQELDSLEVQSTGEPLSGTLEGVSSDNSIFLGTFAIFVLLAAGAFVLARLLKESSEDIASATSPAAAARPKATANKASKTKKAPAKKKTSSGKPVAKKRKKPSRKRK